MPFGSTSRSAAAPAPTPAPTGKLVIATVIDASGTKLLRVGQKFPVLFQIPAGPWSFGAGNQVVKHNFDHDVVILAGVTKSNGNPAKPYPWDARRFRFETIETNGPVTTAKCCNKRTR